MSFALEADTSSAIVALSDTEPRLHGAVIDGLLFQRI